METWFWLALLAMLGYGVQNFLFKVAAEESRNSIRVNTAFMLTVATISGAAYMFTPSSVSGPYFLIFAIANGITYLLANICKIESYKLAPAAVAAPISRMYIALTPILAFFLFRETVTVLQLIGLTLATFSAITLSNEVTKRGERRRNFVIGLVFAAAAAMSTSFNNLIGKAAAVTKDITSFIFFSYLFSFLISLYLQRTVNKDTNPIKNLIKDYNATRLGILIGIINFTSYYLLLRALISGKAMVIFPVIGLGLVITIALSNWHYKEKMSKGTIIGTAAAIGAIATLR